MYAEITESLLDLIYDTMAEPGLWSQVLREIATLVDGPGGIIYGQSIRNNAVAFDYNGGLSEECSRIYQERHVQNAWCLYMADQPVGTLVSSDDILPLAELQRSDFYNDILRPQQIGHGALIALASQRDFFFAFTMNRALSQGAFGRRELDLIERLLPHMRRAAVLGMRIDAYQALQQAQHRLLDQLSMGVVLLDRRGGVLYANSAARRQAGAGSLHLSRSRLSHEVPAQARLLEKLVDRTLRHSPMGAITLSGQEGRNALTVMASSIRNHDRDRLADAGLADAALMLFIYDSANRGEIPLDWIMQAHGLTLAEARVAAAASDGAKVAEIARRLNVLPNTVKTHLHRVFAKTQTSGQAELVRLLAPMAVVSGT